MAYSASNRPTLSDGKVLVGTTSGVFALSPADGGVQWTTETEWPVQTPPRVVGETVVAVSGRFGDRYTVHGVDPAAGEQRWTFAGRFRLTDPAVGERHAYLAESRSGLLALAV